MSIRSVYPSVALSLMTLLLAALPVTHSAHARPGDLHSFPDSLFTLQIALAGPLSTEPFIPGSLSDSLRTGELETIRIRSTRLNEPARFQPVRVESFGAEQLTLYQGNSISELLGRSSTLFVRDNGPGGMALASQRGLSPGQTQVLWEGFPIQSLSLGQADLSLLPAGLFQSAEVSPGTPSSAFGAGSLGGSLYLSSRRDRTASSAEASRNVSAGITAGAFGRQALSLQGASEGERARIYTSASFQRGQNDFPYQHPVTGRTVRRANNTGMGGQLILGGERRLESGSLHGSVWLWDRNEEIPGSILNNQSRAEQGDSGFRFTGGGSWLFDNMRLTPGVFLEQYRFTYLDERIGIDSRFLNSRLLSSIELERASAGRVRWAGGISGGLESVDTNNYSGEPGRGLFAAWLRPQLHLQDAALRLYPALRLDGYSDFGWVVSPSLGFNIELLPERFHLRGAASRDFNPPSFNDLYWQPGGNPSLQPERSTRTEAGLVWLSDSLFLKNVELTAYRIWLHQGIYWMPVSGTIWSPQNVERLNAWGLESRITSESLAGPFLIQLGASTDLRRAEIAKPRFPDDQAVGRQIRYVPQWSARGDLAVSHNPFTLLADYSWTDRRWTTADHSASLPPYQLLDLSLLWQTDWQRTSSTLRLSVRNLLDETYEIIQWYPMPGRHLEFSFQIHLSSSRNTNRLERINQ